ncbi:MAG: serine/threonine-protein kinase [Myxococcota bacterium]
MRRPDVFGKYQLLTKIASGGMAEVWLARSSSIGGFEKLLAIKRIRSSLCKDKSFVSMFIAEAKLTVRLSHPNIVQVFDFGQVDHDYFMAMEYVEGADLSRIARQARHRGHGLPVSACVYIMHGVMNALAYAHAYTGSRGQHGRVIHRDVSPQNILVSYDGNVKVSDFGIAKAVHEVETKSDEIFGKLAYVSPEQCRGDGANEASDIWSAGVVLHELLTNRRLFPRNSDAATMAAVESMVIPRPASLNSKIPPALDELVMACLQRTTSQRLQSAKDAVMRLAMIQGQHFPAETGFFLQEVLRDLWDGQPPRTLPDPSVDLIEDTRAPFDELTTTPRPSSASLSSAAALAEAAARQKQHVSRDSDWLRLTEPTVSARPRPRPHEAFDAQATELDLKPPIPRSVDLPVSTSSPDMGINGLKRMFIEDPNLWVLVDIGRAYASKDRKADALGAFKLAAAKFAQGGLLVQAACIYRHILDMCGTTSKLREEIRRLPSFQGVPNAELLDQIFSDDDDGVDFSEYNGIFTANAASVDVFHESPILASLNAEQFLSFIEAVTLRKHGGNNTIIAEGDRGTSFYLIGRGRVVVSTNNFQGRKVYITSLTDGDCFGEQSYFTGEPRNATVETLGDALVLEVSKDVLNRVSQEFPTVRESLRRFYKERIAESLLAKSPLFGHLHIRARRELAERFIFESHAPDTTIIREGEPSDAFYAIKSGQVLVSVGVDAGRVVLAELGPGEIFGEIAAIEGTRRNATVITKSECELLRLEAAELNAMLSRNIDIRRQIERTIAQRTAMRERRLDPMEP